MKLRIWEVRMYTGQKSWPGILVGKIRSISENPEDEAIAVFGKKKVHFLREITK